MHVSIATSFDSYSMAEVVLEEGAGVYILTPNKAYITIVAADNNDESSYKLLTSILERDGD